MANEIEDWKVVTVTEQMGIAVTDLVREMVLNDMGCSFEQADWLETLEGVTFRRAWPDAPWTEADEEVGDG